MPTISSSYPFDGPMLPLPEPLRGTDAGSFAYHTVARRLPEIGRQMLRDNDFPPQITRRVEALIEEMPDGRLRELHDPGAPDEAGWNRSLQPYLGLTWLEAPWFVSETYFYRRLLEATGYFQPGPTQGLDPFIVQKRLGLETNRAAIDVLCQEVDRMLALAHSDPASRRPELSRLLRIALWGNQADLSVWSAERTDRPNHQDARLQEQHLLADDRPAILDYLFSFQDRLPQLDFILDNAGLELVGDLALVDFMLNSGAAGRLRLWLKTHPTFVSDAMIKDFRQTVDFLASSSEPCERLLAQRLSAHLQADRLALAQDWFWTSPLSMWQMPSGLYQELAKADLVISKGDANYRRLLGDLHWPFSTPFGDVLRYSPAPLAALRVLKADIVVGLDPELPERLDQEDPDWLIDGRWGLIQFEGLLPNTGKLDR